MFHLNRIKYLILILLFVPFIPSVEAIVEPTNNFYVNDYANILSSETEEYILNKSIALNKVDGTQIVVVTVENLEGMTLENYATQLFRNFGIGNEEKDNGLLLLLALEEREFRVEVGYGLEGILPDGKTGRFQDEYIIPYLKKDSWDDGIKNGYDAFYKEIVTLNNLNIDYSEPTNSKNIDNINTWLGNNNEFIRIIAIIIGFFFGFLIRYSRKKIRTKKTLIYLGIWSILFLVSIFYLNSLLSEFIFNLCCFLCARFIDGSSFDSHSGSFRGSSSRGVFSSGGGSSGGGGSSRKF